MSTQDPLRETQSGCCLTSKFEGYLRVLTFSFWARVVKISLGAELTSNNTEGAFGVVRFISGKTRIIFALGDILSASSEVRAMFDETRAILREVCLALGEVRFVFNEAMATIVAAQVHLEAAQRQKEELELNLAELIKK
ncbi:uncharacterized protein A4U43_C03F27160 [Asparagus officinalis]|uniref:Uncharacterized protein n=1 Tax=Asparagus officinalis TaxID=4686 RepID=A0A5P1FDE2_ASPOF|nr:uncharacterized protein A4U43_C03F27160 [Asparagus officinalis]